MKIQDAPLEIVPLPGTPAADHDNYNRAAHALNDVESDVRITVNSTGNSSLIAFANQQLQTGGVDMLAEGLPLGKIGTAMWYDGRKDAISWAANTFWTPLSPTIEMYLNNHYNTVSGEVSTALVQRLVNKSPSHPTKEEAWFYKCYEERLLREPWIRNNPEAFDLLNRDIKRLDYHVNFQDQPPQTLVNRPSKAPPHQPNVLALLGVGWLKEADAGSNPMVYVDNLCQNLRDEGFYEAADLVEEQFKLAQEWQQKSFDEINKKCDMILDELKFTNHRVNLLYENMIQEKQKELRRLEQERIKANFEYAQAISSAFVVFAHQIGKPPSLIKIARVADSATHNLAPTLYQLSKTLPAKDLLAIAGTFANLSVAVFQIASLLLSKEGPTFEQRVLQELQAIRQDIDALRTEMNANFMEVFDQLDVILREVQKGFAETLYEIRISTHYMVNYLQNIESRLIFLGKQQKVAINSFWLRDLQRTIADIDAYEERMESLHELPRDQFHGYCDNLVRWLNHESAEPISNGECLYAPENSVQIDNEILKDQDIPYLTGYLSKKMEALKIRDPFPGRFNPAIWSRALRHYLRLRKEVRGELVRERDPKGHELARIVGNGKTILNTFADIQSHVQLFSTLFAKYELQVGNVIEAYKKVKPLLVHANLHNDVETAKMQEVKAERYQQFLAIHQAIDPKQWCFAISKAPVYAHKYHHKEKGDRKKHLAEIDTWNGLLAENGAVHQYFQLYLHALEKELGNLQPAVPMKNAAGLATNRPLAPFFYYPMLDLYLPTSVLFNNQHFQPPPIPDVLLQAERLGIGKFVFTHGDAHYSHNTFQYHCSFRTDRGQEFPVLDVDLCASNPKDDTVEYIKKYSRSSAPGDISIPFQRTTDPTIFRIEAINAWSKVNAMTAFKFHPELTERIEQLEADYKQQFDEYYSKIVNPQLSLPLDEQTPEHNKTISRYQKNYLELDNLYRLIHAFSQIAGFDEPTMEALEELCGADELDKVPEDLADYLTGWLKMPDGRQRKVVDQTEKGRLRFSEIRQKILGAVQSPTLQQLVVLRNPVHHSIHELLEEHVAPLPNPEIVKEVTLGNPPPPGVLNALYDELFFLGEASGKYQAMESKLQACQGKYLPFLTGDKITPQPFYFREHRPMHAARQFEVMGMQKGEICKVLRDKSKQKDVRDWLGLEIATMLLALEKSWSALTTQDQQVLSKARELDVQRQEFFTKVNQQIKTTHKHRSLLSVNLCSLLLMDLYLEKLKLNSKRFDFKITPTTHGPTFCRELLERFHEGKNFGEENLDRLDSSLAYFFSVLSENAALREEYNQLIDKYTHFVDQLVLDCSDQAHFLHYLDDYLSKDGAALGILTLLYFRERIPHMLLWSPSNETTLTLLEKIPSVGMVSPHKSCLDGFHPKPTHHLIWRPHFICQFAEMTEQSQQDIVTVKGIRAPHRPKQEEKNRQWLQAAADNNLATLKEAKLAGAELFARDEKGYSALAHAAKHGNVEMIRYLCDQAKEAKMTLTRLSTYREPLPRKAQRYDELFRLVDFAVNQGDFIPLMLAARYGHVKAVVELLKHDPASASFKNSMGVSAALIAALYGHQEVLQALLERAADSKHLLEVASVGSNVKMLRWLLLREIGALKLVEPSNAAIATYLGNLAVLKALYHKDPEGSVNSLTRDTPFPIELSGKETTATRAMLAIQQDHVDVLKWLIEICFEAEEALQTAPVKLLAGDREEKPVKEVTVAELARGKTVHQLRRNTLRTLIMRDWKRAAELERGFETLDRKNGDKEPLQEVLKRILHPTNSAGFSLDIRDYLAFGAVRCLEAALEYDVFKPMDVLWNICWWHAKYADNCVEAGELIHELNQVDINAAPFLHRAIKNTADDDDQFLVVKLLCEVFKADLNKVFDEAVPGIDEREQEDVLHRTPLQQAEEGRNQKLIDYIKTRPGQKVKIEQYRFRLPDCCRPRGRFLKGEMKQTWPVFTIRTSDGKQELIYSEALYHLQPISDSSGIVCYAKKPFANQQPPTDRGVKIVDLLTGKPLIHQLRDSLHTDHVFGVWQRTDGLFVTVYPDGFKVWNKEGTYEKMFPFSLPGPIGYHSALIADDRILLCNSDHKELRLFQLPPCGVGQPATSGAAKQIAIQALPAKSSDVHMRGGGSWGIKHLTAMPGQQAIAFDGNRLSRVSIQGDRITIDKTVDFSFAGGSLSCNPVPMSGNRFVVGTSAQIQIYDLHDMRCIKTFEAGGGVCGVLALAVSPDSKHIASGSDNNEIKIWNVETGECRVLPFPVKAEHKNPGIQSIVFLEGKLVAVSNYGEVFIWE